MGIELMLNAVNINLVAFWRYLNPTNITGRHMHNGFCGCWPQKVAVGLGLFISVYRHENYSRWWNRSYEMVINSWFEFFHNWQSWGIQMNLETVIWLIPLPPCLRFLSSFLITNRSKSISMIVCDNRQRFFRGQEVCWYFGQQQTHFTLENIFSSTGSGSHWREWFTINVWLIHSLLQPYFLLPGLFWWFFIYSIGYHNFGQPKVEKDRPGLPHKRDRKDPHGHTHHVPSVEPMYSRFFAFIWTVRFWECICWW